MEHSQSSTRDQHALVARANDGDTAALEQLYRDHRDWVLAVAYRFTGSHDDSLDVLQETFVYFYSKFPGFALRSSIRGFLYPVVKHSSITVIRRRKKVVDLDARIKSGQLALPGIPQQSQELSYDVVAWLEVSPHE